MSENDSDERMNTTKVITNTIWDIQNKLRSEGITGIDALNHITTIILIRSLTNIKCRNLGIPEDLSWESIKKLAPIERYTKIHNTGEQGLLWYLKLNNRWGISNSFSFKITNHNTFDYIITKLNNISNNLLKSRIDIIGDIYEHFINREGKTMKDLGQYFTDRTLVKYLIDMTKPKIKENGNIETIWDPAAGTGGFILMYIHYMNKHYPNIDWSVQKHNIYANELNTNTYSLLKQNIYYAIDNISDTCYLEDSLTCNAPNSSGFDILILNPPFGIKGIRYTNMNDKIKKIKINGTKAEVLFLQNCMGNLKKGGRCCIVIPDSILFGSAKLYKETRQHLLNNFEVHKIIKLVGNDFFTNTGVEASVLFFENTGNSTSSISVVEINKEYDSIKEKHIMDINIEDIIKNKYSLNINLFKEFNVNVKDGYTLVTLLDCMEYIKGPAHNVKDGKETGTYPLLRSSKNNRVKWLDTYDYEGPYIAIGTGGVANFHYVSKFNISTHFKVIKNKDNINLKYLYYILNLHIKEQINIVAFVGSALKGLNIEIFNNIKIALPPMNIQEELVRVLDNKYASIEDLKKKINYTEREIETVINETFN